MPSVPQLFSAATSCICGLPKKSDFLHSALPSPFRIQFQESPSDHWGTGMYLLSGCHYFIYILLFSYLAIYIYLYICIYLYIGVCIYIYISSSYFTDILPWHYDHLLWKLKQFLHISVTRMKVKNPFFSVFFENGNGKKYYLILKQGQKAVDKWDRASSEVTGDLIMELKLWHEIGKNLTGICISCIPLSFFFF